MSLTLYLYYVCVENVNEMWNQGLTSLNVMCKIDDNLCGLGLNFLVGNGWKFYI